MPFRDRREAGERLLQALKQRNPVNPVIVALPRGGVPVAAVLAEGLEAPLELAIVRKIGAPGQRELAVGAVSDGAMPHYTINRDIARLLGLTRSGIEALAAPELETIRKRKSLYYGNRVAVSLRGRTAILVDDGVATGATMKMAASMAREQGPASLWLAIPVAPADVLAELRGIADTVVCLEVPEPFMAVGAHYRCFDQVDDSEVVAIMRAFDQSREERA